MLRHFKLWEPCIKIIKFDLEFRNQNNQSHKIHGKILTKTYMLLAKICYLQPKAQNTVLEYEEYFW